eukprot:597275-Rhodomonas_salina.1
MWGSGRSVRSLLGARAAGVRLPGRHPEAASRDAGAGGEPHASGRSEKSRGGGGGGGGGGLYATAQSLREGGSWDLYASQQSQGGLGSILERRSVDLHSAVAQEEQQHGGGQSMSAHGQSLYGSEAWRAAGLYGSQGQSWVLYGSAESCAGRYHSSYSDKNGISNMDSNMHSNMNSSASNHHTDRHSSTADRSSTESNQNQRNCKHSSAAHRDSSFRVGSSARAGRVQELEEQVDALRQELAEERRRNAALDEDACEADADADADADAVRSCSSLARSASVTPMARERGGGGGGGGALLFERGRGAGARAERE